MDDKPIVIPLKLKYRSGYTTKRTMFKPKYERQVRRASKRYMKFCREHPKCRS